MFEHYDVLEDLNTSAPLGHKLRSIHATLKQRFDFIDRLAVAIYDHKTDLLKTYIHSSGNDEPLRRYESRLADAKSLQEIVRQRRPRVVNDLSIFRSGPQAHTQAIAGQGYAASYTMPMYLNDELMGFVFFNSYQQGVFNEDVLRICDLFGHLISLTVINEQTNLRTLVATVRTAHDMTHHRDTETGSHVDRMSRYARLIARTLAEQYHLDDQYIENIFLFSPLHDIGKIAIPDQILHKPGALDSEERAVMMTHAEKGREIIDKMLTEFELNAFENIQLLRNIAEFHHEAVDGSGYPRGLVGNAIPLEARIVAVADIFDALTSKRPYKEAWSNDAAFSALRGMAGERLDQDCVEALITNREQIESIQHQFVENPLG